MKELKQSILESLEELYHYTNNHNLNGICGEDILYASQNDGVGLKKYDYFVSTSRQINTLTGYPKSMISDKICRIVFDRVKLSKFKIGPVDWGRAKGYAIKANWEDKEFFDKHLSTIKEQPNVESEERIYLKNDCIPQVHKYIKRIDIDSSTVSYNELLIVKKYCDKHNIELKLSEHSKFIYGK